MPALTLALTSTPNTSKKVIILDVKVDETKKIVKRKKHFWVVNVLKESIGTTSITKYILDLEVNLTISKLLVSAPAV